MDYQVLGLYLKLNLQILDLLLLYFVIYIYNPTVHTFSISVRDTSWKWDQTQPYWTNMDVLPGWNKVEIKLEVITASDDKKVMILGNDNSLNLDWKGQWLFSSLVGVPRKL